jgi:hypothetical protein
MHTATKRTTASGQPRRGSPGRELLFVAEPSHPSSWTGAVEHLRAAGCARIGLRLLDEAAAGIAEPLVAQFGAGRFRAIGQGGDALHPVKAAAPGDVDAVLLIGGNADQVSAALIDYLDERLAIAAPATQRYWRKLPLYLISIPKAGTHLLFQLAEALGYRPGGPSPPRPAGGHWYYLLDSNAHTEAAAFFRDALQKAPFGNRTHPFMRSPALFGYRHPLDIVVSEANYLRTDGNSPLYVLLSQLSVEECVERLIDDPWLLGSIRDRMGAFAAWLDCSNVVPVSFEEMVGETGGGTDEARTALIWSLQLKLHVPGRPDAIAARMSSRGGATFREGRIGGWREVLSAAAYRRFAALPQDFMEKFGYGLAAGDATPAHAARFRHRPLHLSAVGHDEVPILIEAGYIGHNLIAYRGRYYAVEVAAGDLDLASVSAERLAKFPSDDDLAALRVKVQLAAESVRRVLDGRINEEVRRSIASAVAAYVDQDLAQRERDKVGAVHERGSFLRYNVVERSDTLLAIPQHLGAVDPRELKLAARPGVLAASGPLALRLRIVWAWIRWAYWDGAKL